MQKKKATRRFQGSQGYLVLEEEDGDDDDDDENQPERKKNERSVSILYQGRLIDCSILLLYTGGYYNVWDCLCRLCNTSMVYGYN